MATLHCCRASKSVGHVLVFDPVLMIYGMYNLHNIKDIKGMHIANLNTRSMVNKWDIIKLSLQIVTCM